MSTGGQGGMWSQGQTTNPLQSGLSMKQMGPSMLPPWLQGVQKQAPQPDYSQSNSGSDPLSQYAGQAPTMGPSSVFSPMLPYGGAFGGAVGASPFAPRFPVWGGPKMMPYGQPTQAQDGPYNGSDSNGNPAYIPPQSKGMPQGSLQPPTMNGGIQLPPAGMFSPPQVQPQAQQGPNVTGGSQYDPVTGIYSNAPRAKYNVATGYNGEPKGRDFGLTDTAASGRGPLPPPPKGPMQAGQYGWGWSGSGGQGRVGLQDEGPYTAEMSPAARQYIISQMYGSGTPASWANKVDPNDLLGSIGRLSGNPFKG